MFSITIPGMAKKGVWAMLPLIFLESLAKYTTKLSSTWILLLGHPVVDSRKCMTKIFHWSARVKAYPDKLMKSDNTLSCKFYSILFWSVHAHSDTDMAWEMLLVPVISMWLASHWPQLLAGDPSLRLLARRFSTALLILGMSKLGPPRTPSFILEKNQTPYLLKV